MKKIDKRRAEMNVSQDEFAQIASLDLEPIKVKLMHRESGEGWSMELANAVEFEYRRFLYLMKKYPEEQASPSVDVDTFWHYHILDTMKYAEDCQAVFGHFLHHFPYLGLRGEEDLLTHQRVGERMRTLYEDTFAETYPFAGGDADEESPAVAANANSEIAYSTRPIGSAYSTRPTASAYSTLPAASAYSTRPTTSAYSTRPTASAYSTRPTGSAYSTRPTGSAYSTRPTASAYSTRPTGSAYSTRPVVGEIQPQLADRATT
jgi:hypothetical protein